MRLGGGLNVGGGRSSRNPAPAARGHWLGLSSSPPILTTSGDPSSFTSGQPVGPGRPLQSPRMASAAQRQGDPAGRAPFPGSRCCPAGPRPARRTSASPRSRTSARTRGGSSSTRTSPARRGSGSATSRRPSGSPRAWRPAASCSEPRSSARSRRWRCSRATAMPAASSARRSTPSPRARSATPPTAPGCSALARELTGFDIRVLTVEEEARYGHLAAVNTTGARRRRGARPRWRQPAARARARPPRRGVDSWPLGAVRVTERLLPGDGPVTRKRAQARTGRDPRASSPTPDGSPPAARTWSASAAPPATSPPPRSAAPARPSPPCRARACTRALGG